MDPFAADLAEVLDDTRQSADITQAGVTRRVRIAIADVTHAGAGYIPIDGETLTTSATILRSDCPFRIDLDAIVTAGGHRYRVTGVTETLGDPAISLTLAIEGSTL